MKGNSKILEQSNTISNKEMKILIDVICKYNLKLVSAVKVRNAYMIVTPNGNFCLKRRKHGRNRIKNECILTEELFLNEFSNTAMFFKTNEGSSCVRYKKSIFFLTEWIQGLEADLTNIDNAVICTKLLAEFHVSSNKIKNNKMELPKGQKNCPRIFADKLKQFEKFKKIIENKRMRNEFDVLFMENVNDFYYRGIAAINILDKSQYYKLLKSSNDKNTICLNSFSHQNIIRKDDQYFLIDLENISIDLQIGDLGKFIRRLMFSKSYGWNFYFAKEIIQAYNNENTLSKDDLELMLAFIIFPSKLWKLGKQRYLKQKKYSETKYLHKLTKITKYNENQNIFFKDYINFLEEYK